MVLSKAKFAGFCGYPSRQVSNWIDEGLPVKTAGRKGVELEIDTAEAIGWLLGRRDVGHSDGSASRQTALSEERRRLVAAQSEKTETENRLRKDELFSADEVEAIVCEGTAVFTGQKRAMGSRLAGQLAGMTDPVAILKLLNSENDKILLELSKKLSALADRANS